MQTALEGDQAERKKKKKKKKIREERKIERRKRKKELTSSPIVHQELKCLIEGKVPFHLKDNQW